MTFAQAALHGSGGESALWLRLSKGDAHGLQTSNGGFWICHESLLLEAEKPD